MPTRQRLTPSSAMGRKLAAAGNRLAKARGAEQAAWGKAKALAVQAITAGHPETTVAALLGVDRMTVRKWIGKR